MAYIHVSDNYRSQSYIKSQGMQLLKEKRQYMQDEVKGFISNTFSFTIKDLYKKGEHDIQSDNQMIDCEYCGVYLVGPKCLWCGEPSEDKVPELCRNWKWSRPAEEEETSVECMIIMVDLSGSMNLTYPSRYKKINKDYVVRVIGSKNFEILRKAIGEEEVCKNFKSIEMLFETGQSARDIAFSMKEELAFAKNKGMNTGQKEDKENLQYISRKEIIQVGITHYINTIKSKRPNTIMTVVYFNSNIEYPVMDFAQCKIVGDLEKKSLEDLIEAGKQAASQISLMPIQQIGDKLITNMTKAEADGPTAMTPALAFCLGMASKWKHDLNQIVIVTDGLSNVGIGQTEEQQHLEASKKLYEELALKYAIKSNSVVNIISFEDCAIGYDVIDEIIKRTGGVPYSIDFKQEKKEKIVEDNTINFLIFEMMTGFCESTKQFCFDNKMVVRIDLPEMTIKIPQDLEHLVKIKEKNWVSFDMGVRSVNQNFQFGFILDSQYKLKDNKAKKIKLTVMHQYRRSKKISFIVREHLLDLIPGEGQQVIQSEANILKKELINKLKTKIEDSTFEQYESLAKKLQKVQVVETIDKQIIDKFNKKKVKMQEYDKDIDAITRDKRRIESRRKETYNRRKYSEEDIFE